MTLQSVFSSILIILCVCIIVAIISAVLWIVFAKMDFNSNRIKMKHKIWKSVITVIISCFNNGVSMDNEQVYSIDYDNLGTP